MPSMNASGAHTVSDRQHSAAQRCKLTQAQDSAFPRPLAGKSHSCCVRADGYPPGKGSPTTKADAEPVCCYVRAGAQPPGKHLPTTKAGPEPVCCCVRGAAQPPGKGFRTTKAGAEPVCCCVNADAQPPGGSASGFSSSPTTTGAPTASRPGLIISLRALAATMLTQRAYSGFSAYVMIPGCSRNCRRTCSMLKSAMSQVRMRATYCPEACRRKGRLQPAAYGRARAVKCMARERCL